MDLSEYRRMARVEQTHWWYRGTRSLLRQLLTNELQKVASSNSLEILDAGCGTGATGAWMSDIGSVTALDSRPEALAIYAEQHTDAKTLLGDICAIDLPNDSVDVTLCVTVLYHADVLNPQQAVIELSRVTRPGGIVILMEPGVRRLRRGHDRITHAARRFSKGDLESLAHQASLDVIRSTGAYTFLVPPAFIKARLERQMSTSDLDSNSSGLLGILGFLARCERLLLRSISMPFGLSVIIIARKIP